MDKYRIIVKGIVQKADKYLVVEKWYDDRIFEPYQWEFIDGVAEFGELPDKAVLRVVEEKTGISSEVGKILYTWGFMVGEVYNLGISYLCLTDMEDVVLSEDLHDYAWITRDKFKEYITNQAVLADLEKSGLTEVFDPMDLGKVGQFFENLD